ncbi:hypothetical protein [Rhodomicrobium lacus]|uniref:hypothetical protein n=1 Tax=Rhodomicrobium lacus TaxID=2498452 RepID=UPI0026E28B03|nr:hypothetical protein [Rhodomicrobium lacus]WKW49490.1 hypothetical protein QMO75_09250 [Rhodomicrobium lacus]
MVERLILMRPLYLAEKKLISCVSSGKTCQSSLDIPQNSSFTNTIRGSFLRSLLVSKKCHSSGLSVAGAYIKGHVNLDGTNAIVPLRFSRCVFDALSFADASVKSMIFDRVIFSKFVGYSAKVDGDIFLKKCEIKSALELFGIEVTGTLCCKGSKIGVNEDVTSVNLITASIGGQLEFRDGFYSEGVIHLDDSKINGSLNCSNATFAGATKATFADHYDHSNRSLSALRIEIRGDLLFRNSHSVSELCFMGARIRGGVDCSGGRFDAVSKEDPLALRFSRTTIGGNVYFRNSVFAAKVEFRGSKISGGINCERAEFIAPNIPTTDLSAPDEDLSFDALSLVNATVDGGLFLRGAKFDGSLDLKSAHVGVLVDCKDSWPIQPKKGFFFRPIDRKPRNAIHLDGFTFDRFGGNAPRGAAKRLKWLKHQPKTHMGSDFRPQPFEQLIKVLRDMGASGRCPTTRDRARKTTSPKPAAAIPETRRAMGSCRIFYLDRHMGLDDGLRIPSAPSFGLHACYWINVRRVL